MMDSTRGLVAATSLVSTVRLAVEITGRSGGGVACSSPSSASDAPSAGGAAAPVDACASNVEGPASLMAAAVAECFSELDEHAAVVSATAAATATTPTR